MEGIDTDEIDCDTCLKIQEILSDEFDDPEFLALVHNCLRGVDAVIVKERVHCVNVQKPIQVNISINIR